MPVEPFAEDEPDAPEQGMALALSGGGYRATAFHLGALIRLNEAGLLKRLSRISSVSGGSITAAVLGVNWTSLRFVDGVAENLVTEVIDPVRRMLGTSVDAGAIVGGILLPGTIGERVAKAYDRVLFGGRTLQDLPEDAGGKAPRFVINATNVRSGALWRFSRPYMGDYRVGMVKKPITSIATAVAASSAFPPVLSPMPVKIAQPFETTEGADLVSAAYRGKALLTDGGVYDNLGLETIEKRYTTLLVSDAGMKMAADPQPKEDWAGHSMRVLDMIDNQVRSLRVRRLIDAYERNDRSGCYWSVRARFRNYAPNTDPLGCAGRDATALAATPTRLEAMPAKLQEQLVNWGYAITDASLRKNFAAEALALYQIEIKDPLGFPYARGY